MKYFPILSLLFVLTACNSSTTNSVSDKKSAEVTNEIVADTSKKNLKPMEGDPTFVEPKEVISRFGPDNITRYLIQDRNGNFWLASWSGIIKYDGAVFTNYTLKENLERFHALSLLEDRQGRIWIGTVGGGLYCYNGTSFTRFTIKNGLAGDLVYCIYEDNSGLIWIGTNNGLSVYDGKTFKNYSTVDGLDHNLVYTIMQDGKGTVWIGTKGALCYCNPSSVVSNTSLRIMKKEGPFADVRIMYKDKNARLWMGTSQSGVLCYDYNLPDGIGPDKAFRVLTQKDGLSDNFISSISEDSKGNMWFGGNVCYYDGKKFTQFKIKEVQNSTNVFCVYGDKNGNMWFANSSGVLRYDGKYFEDFSKRTKSL